MANTLAGFSALVLGLSGFGCASSDEARPSDDPTFRGCQNGFDADYQPLSAAELVDRADLIVRGHFEAISDGRIAIDTAFGSSTATPLLVYRLQVAETLKGEPREKAYLERMRGGCTAEASAIPVPDEEVMLFLRPPGWDPDAYVFEYPDRGHPPGEPLWVLLTEQALLLESEGIASPILEPYDTSFTRGSLDAVGSEVRALLEAP